jgi:hypothetical protein
MNEKYLKYVNDFNTGDIDHLVDMFDSMENILRFFHKKDLLQYIDPFDTDVEDYQLEILNYLLNVVNDKKTLEYCVAQLSDIVVKDGGYYLRVKDREDLSDLFYDGGRDTSARDVAKAVFGEDMWEPYSNTTDDVYRDVIEELNPDNVERLKKYILDVLTNWKIEVDDGSPDLFNNYSDDGIFYLTSENVGDVIGDEESMKYLMNEGYLDDLESELSSIHFNAYNQAYESEIYTDVMNELETFFDTKSAKWEASPPFEGSQKLVEFYYLKFNPNEVANSIKKYIADRNNWGYSENNISYVSTWLNMMNTFMDNGDEPWLDFRIPDYADGYLVDKYINEMFPDYI